MESDLIPWIFASIMAVGVIYLLFSILAGGLADVDADVDVHIHHGTFDFLHIGHGDSGEARGLGCSVLSAFLAGFGSMGLLGSLSGWNVLFSILAGLVFGLIFGRSTVAVLRFVLRQQSSDLMTTDSLIGTYARITVDTPPGRTGEALVEGESLIKYPVRATSDDIALKKGDYVEIVRVEKGRLYVKKKRADV